MQDLKQELDPKPSEKTFRIRRFVSQIYNCLYGPSFSSIHQHFFILFLYLYRDGLRDRLDHQIYIQNYVYKLVLSQWGSCLTDKQAYIFSASVVDPHWFQCGSGIGSSFLSQCGSGSRKPNQCGSRRIRILIRLLSHFYMKNIPVLEVGKSCILIRIHNTGFKKPVPY